MMRMKIWATIDAHIETTESDFVQWLLHRIYGSMCSRISISLHQPHSNRASGLRLAPRRLLVLDRHITASGTLVLAADIVLQKY